MAPQTAISKAVCYKTKNEQPFSELFIFCLLPPTSFMQVYQLFFAPLPEYLAHVLVRFYRGKLTRTVVFDMNRDCLLSSGEVDGANIH